LIAVKYEEVLLYIRSWRDYRVAMKSKK
jgi:hypothetical protein